MPLLPQLLAARIRSGLRENAQVLCQPPQPQRPLHPGGCHRTCAMAAAPRAPPGAHTIMYKPSPHHAAIIAARAQAMRSAPTASERLLWDSLRGKKLGVAFRRQLVVGPFIVDLVAPSAKLIVEVDGGYHSRRVGPDARRDAKLARAGYRVLHIPAELVLRELPRVLGIIREALALPVP
jgi:very-short-patch-repair endonuclease